METKLSKALQKYYARKGNRIVFSNGMSLNQLATEMWERLGYQEIDSSVLSKVLKGERVFNIKQLSIFCSVLNLDHPQEKQLTEKLKEYVLSKFGFKIGSFLSNELLADNIDKIREARLNGSVRLAMQWSEQLIPGFDINSDQTNLILFTELFREYINCLSETVDPDTNYINVKKISKTLDSISLKSKNENLNKLTHWHLANAAYQSEDYAVALAEYETGLTAEMSVMEKVIALSAALISASNLKNKSTFELYKKQAIALEPQCESYMSTTLYGGLARAEAFANNMADSYKYFEKADFYNNKNISSRGPQTVLKTVQLRRTQVEIGTKIPGIFSKNYLEKSGREAIFLAQQFGYQRYVDQIGNLLNSI